MTDSVVPILSVVVPVRNEERFIRPCLTSILADAPAGGIEVIVVDGMSDDKTASIVEEMARADRRIRLIPNPSRFVPRAMNLGIAAAIAPFIGRIDGHCIVVPGYFRGCLDRLHDGGYEYVGGILVQEGSTPMELAVAAAMTSRVGVGSARFRTVRTDTDELVDTLSFGVYRRDLFDRIGLFDEEFVRNQDDELSMRLIGAGFRILLAPSLRIRYFVRGSLRQLWRQYFQYGYWKWRVFAKHGRFASIRHLAPSTFLLCLIVTLVLAIFSSAGRIAFALVAGPYLLIVALESLRIRLTTSAGFVGTALALMTLHFSYGSGLLKAILDAAWQRIRGRAAAPPTEMSR